MRLGMEDTVSAIKWFWGDSRYRANLVVMAFATGCLIAVPESPLMLLPGIGLPASLAIRYRRWVLAQQSPATEEELAQLD